jgi:hypothetical protein
MRVRRTITAALLVLLLAAPAAAHDGPPYPILVDEPTPDYVVSVWADPDVGIGTFHVMLRPRPGVSLDETPQVQVTVHPATGRLLPVSYPGRLKSRRGEIHFIATPQFDREETWTVDIGVQRAADRTSHLRVDVDVTPPGPGPWMLLVYSIPFLFLGIFWAFALLRRWRYGDVDEGLRRAKEADDAARRLNTQ